MKFYFAASLAALTISGACFAQDPLGSVRPAALAFSEKNPITLDTYQTQAKSYLIVRNNLLDKLPESMRQETKIRAREFTSFSAGLFATYSPEETMSCLSWQSFDDVVAKHAELAISSKDVDYPMVSALVNLKFACFTKQEAERIAEGLKKKQTTEAAGDEP